GEVELNLVEGGRPRIPVAQYLEDVPCRGPFSGAGRRSAGAGEGGRRHRVRGELDHELASPGARLLPLSILRRHRGEAGQQDGPGGGVERRPVDQRHGEAAELVLLTLGECGGGETILRRCGQTLGAGIPRCRELPSRLAPLSALEGQTAQAQV